MKYSQRPKYERRNETIAVLVMILLCIPVLFIYFSSVSYTHLSKSEASEL